MKFDASGKLLKSFGAEMFIFPHGISVDPEGNIWVTDGQGRDGKGQQVFKFSPDGKVLMTLGKAGVAGDGPDIFNQPDDVAIAPRTAGRANRILARAAPRIHPDLNHACPTAVAADAAGNVYGAEVGPKDVKKYVRK